MSIPVIGTAVVNSTFWLNKLISSIDYPVDNFFIVNNNGRGQIDDELDALKRIQHPFIKKISVTHLPANLGCAGAWNLIIKCYMLSPYWIIVNDDVSFTPGFLEEMAMKADDNPDVGLIHGNPGDFNVGSWDLFLIKDFTVQSLGLFDENVYPYSCDDADYIMRLLNKPVKKILSLDKKYYHGMEIAADGAYYNHGSQTKKTDPELAEKLAKINEMNIDYLTRKWGSGWRMCGPNTTPYEGEEKSLGYAPYDLEFVRSKHLGF